MNIARRTRAFGTVVLLSLIVAGSAYAQDDPARKTGGCRPPALDLQVILDRAGFSPGEIDAVAGSRTAKALAAFQAANQLSGSGQLDCAAWQQMAGNGGPPLTKYTITADDIAGPFVHSISRELPDQATLPALSYTSAIEELGEKFHASPALLRKLNPGSGFAAGDTVTVPNVRIEQMPLTASSRSAERPPRSVGTTGQSDVTVTVSKTTGGLMVKSVDGRVVMYAPVTVGSEHDPLPIGTWKVTGVQMRPTFLYNPALFWDADPSHSKAKIAPGPNNPVGLVWIDLDKPHYGIHGTPEPSRIGYSESHGCVRLTNWDALKLAALVRPGTKVIFEN